MASPTYDERVAAEKSRFAVDTHVHDLPEVFDYWSNQYLKPRIAALGFDGPQELFNRYAEQQCASNKSSICQFISLGSGNGDSEINLACHLRSKGYTQFRVECLELSPAMLERGQAAASASDVSGHLVFVEGDLNFWQPSHKYHGVLANMSLHHVVELEALFDRVKRALHPNGTFVISDMIGRNGHQRWPEALAIVHEFWRKLPPTYRINRQLNRYEEWYQNWDCSFESFEGIRSEDILPLLIQRFQFQLFFAFGNIIDPFIDRAFGPNFSVNAEWDRAFIDSVQMRDKEELSAGRISPTHMFAVLANETGSELIHEEPFTPEFCVRKAPRASDRGVGPSYDFPYEWVDSPHNPPGQLQIICSRLAVAEEKIRKDQQFASHQEQELKARANWALGLEQQLNERTEWALKMKKDLEWWPVAQLQRYKVAVLERIQRKLKRIPRVPRATKKENAR